MAADDNGQARTPVSLQIKDLRGACGGQRTVAEGQLAETEGFKSPVGMRPAELLAASITAGITQLVRQRNSTSAPTTTAATRLVKPR